MESLSESVFLEALLSSLLPILEFWLSFSAGSYPSNDRRLPAKALLHPAALGGSTLPLLVSNSHEAGSPTQHFPLSSGRTAGGYMGSNRASLTG